MTDGERGFRRGTADECVNEYNDSLGVFPELSILYD